MWPGLPASRIWVIAMRCRAALIWRLPERVSRTRPAVLPDHTGIGGAAVTGERGFAFEPGDPGGFGDEFGCGQFAAAGQRQQFRCHLLHAVADSLSECVDHVGEPGDVGQLVAGEFG